MEKKIYDYPSTNIPDRVTQLRMGGTTKAVVYGGEKCHNIAFQKLFSDFSIFCENPVPRYVNHSKEVQFELLPPQLPNLLERRNRSARRKMTTLYLHPPMMANENSSNAICGRSRYKSLPADENIEPLLCRKCFVSQQQSENYIDGQRYKTVAV